VLLQAWFPGDADGEALRQKLAERLLELGEEHEPELRSVADEDWSASWKAGWVPVRLSPRLWAVPSWLDAPPLAPGEVALSIDPGMAFGTGTHATTAGCMALADRWLASRAGATVLDVGTGTGLLAFGALALGASRALGVDPDPAAVEASVANAAANGLGDRFEARLGSTDAAPGRWDLVFANLLAPLLERLAAELAAAVAPGGALLVSGLLERQGPSVLAAFAAQGLVEAERVADGGWLALRLSAGDTAAQ